jgi:hypothetical protein
MVIDADIEHHKGLSDTAWAGSSIEHLSVWLLGRELENDRPLVAKVTNDHWVLSSVVRGSD